jgi:hypothetical protein
MDRRRTSEPTWLAPMHQQIVMSVTVLIHHQQQQQPTSPSPFYALCDALSSPSPPRHLRSLYFSRMRYVFALFLGFLYLIFTDFIVAPWTRRYLHPTLPRTKPSIPPRVRKHLALIEPSSQSCARHGRVLSTTSHFPAHWALS